MNILINQHPHYNYLDSTCIQGLQNLGHSVYSGSPKCTNYVEKTSASDEHFDLFIEFHRDGSPWPNLPSVMCWGEDDHRGLEKQFQKGFDAVFVRDHLPGQPGFPMNFGIETRYYCVTSSSKYKPLKDRGIDVCFLGSLWKHRAEYMKRLQADFGKKYRLELGPRKFNKPDDAWSKVTLPYCAHDPRYFETLNNSKICLSFKGAGPDTARTWECLASGAVPLVENLGTVMVEEPRAYFFEDYTELKETIELVLDGIGEDTEGAQAAIDADWQWNREHHSTTARAKYLLDTIGV